MSQQRVHVPDASLPSAGFARALVPPFRRYCQGTATSCPPSRRTSLPSLGGTMGTRMFRSRRRCVWQRRAWGWSPGIPARVGFRGDGRNSQVPGEPPFPFAHVLRPRPADASLTLAGRSRGPRAGNDEGADDNRLSRLNSMAFGLAAHVSRCWLPVTAQGWLPGAGQALLGGLSPAGLLQKVFNSLHVRWPPFPSFLAQSLYRTRARPPDPSKRARVRCGSATGSTFGAVR